MNRTSKGKFEMSPEQTFGKNNSSYQMHTLAQHIKPRPITSKRNDAKTNHSSYKEEPYSLNHTLSHTTADFKSSRENTRMKSSVVSQNNLGHRSRSKM